MKFSRFATTALLAIAACLLLTSCALFRLPDRLTLERATYADMPGWDKYANHVDAVYALEKSCERFNTLPDGWDVGDIGGELEDWRLICSEVSVVANKMREERRVAGPTSKLVNGKDFLLKQNSLARSFFERHFTPYLAGNRGNPNGLFTAYYEPEIEGSLKKTSVYKTPIYAKPQDVGGCNMTRREIDRGALDGRKLEIAYAKDPVELFFLEVQGSGRLRLPDGRIIRLNYDGQNGCPYTSIGKYMLNKGYVTRGQLTSPGMKKWLRENPSLRTKVMQENESYVFFKVKVGDGPIGAQGVALTPEASMAVDNRFIPYGVPLWVDTYMPKTKATPSGGTYRRLMIAQDRGGAIKGPVRGDIFMGHGWRANELSGYVKQPGGYYVLLPSVLD